MVQKIAVKAGQGVVQLISEGKTVLKVVTMPTQLRTDLPRQMPPTVPANPNSDPHPFASVNPQGTPMLTSPSTSHPQQVRMPVNQLVGLNFSNGRLPAQKLVDLQASFPAHMVPKVSAPQRTPASHSQGPLIINSNGLTRRGYPASTPTKEINNQPNLQPIAVFSPTVPKQSPSSNPPAVSSIPSWAPGGSKPLIKQVKTSSGQLVWAQAVSSEQIHGSDKAVFKFKALGPVDPKNPNTPPPGLLPQVAPIQPCKEPSIQADSNKTQQVVVCPFSNCTETFSSLEELYSHGAFHGSKGEKGSCPHCKIGYNR